MHSLDSHKLLGAHVLLMLHGGVPHDGNCEDQVRFLHQHPLSLSQPYSVQGSLPWQLIPTWEHAPPGATHESVVQASLSSQIRGLRGGLKHVPPLHRSSVHRLPSLQSLGVPVQPLEATVHVRELHGSPVVHAGQQHTPAQQHQPLHPLHSLSLEGHVEVEAKDAWLAKMVAEGTTVTWAGSVAIWFNRAVSDAPNPIP